MVAGDGGVFGKPSLELSVDVEGVFESSPAPAVVADVEGVFESSPAPAVVVDVEGVALTLGDQCGAWRIGGRVGRHHFDHVGAVRH